STPILPPILLPPPPSPTPFPYTTLFRSPLWARTGLSSQKPTAEPSTREASTSCARSPTGRAPMNLGMAVSRNPSEKLKTKPWIRSEEHTSELQSQSNLVCRLLLEKKKKK